MRKRSLHDEDYNYEDFDENEPRRFTRGFKQATTNKDKRYSRERESQYDTDDEYDERR